jgi:hypothetical protein
MDSRGWSEAEPPRKTVEKKQGALEGRLAISSEVAPPGLLIKHNPDPPLRGSCRQSGYESVRSLQSQNIQSSANWRPGYPVTSDEAGTGVS